MDRQAIFALKLARLGSLQGLGEPWLVRHVSNIITSLVVASEVNAINKSLPTHKDSIYNNISWIFLLSAEKKYGRPVERTWLGQPMDSSPLLSGQYNSDCQWIGRTRELAHSLPSAPSNTLAKKTSINMGLSSQFPYISKDKQYKSFSHSNNQYISRFHDIQFRFKYLPRVSHFNPSLSRENWSCHPRPFHSRFQIWIG